jgi:nicotinamidase-related amidase
MRLPCDATLLVIDVQQGFDLACAGERNNPAAEAAIAELLAAWREMGLPIVHLQHQSSRPASFSQPGAAGHAFKPEALPLPGETVLGKATASAFVDTGLEPLLTSQGCTTLVVCGLGTQRSVLASVHHAGDLGFRIFVVADACAAAAVRDRSGRCWPAEEVHGLALAQLGVDCAAIVDLPTALMAARLSQVRRRGKSASA